MGVRVVASDHLGGVLCLSVIVSGAVFFSDVPQDLDVFVVFFFFFFLLVSFRRRRRH